MKDFHSLNEYLNEKLVINKNYKQYVPASFNELKEIVEQRYKDQGAGTKQNPINFNDIDVSNINSFNDGNLGLFGKTKFEYIDISYWYVSKVEDMNGLFYRCEELKSIGDLSNWDVSKVKYMGSMFAFCKQLKSVGDLSRWNVSKVENMDYMFNGCEKLESVGNLSNWNVSKVEGMYNMFYECRNLKSVGDLSRWNVSKVKAMYDMFDDSGITNTPDWYNPILI